MCKYNDEKMTYFVQKTSNPTIINIYFNFWKKVNLYEFTELLFDYEIIELDKDEYTISFKSKQPLILNQIV